MYVASQVYRNNFLRSCKVNMPDVSLRSVCAITSNEKMLLELRVKLHPAKSFEIYLMKSSCSVSERECIFANSVAVMGMNSVIDTKHTDIYKG